MSLLDTITRTMLVKPHPAGLPFIAGAIVLTIVFFFIWKPLGTLFLILTLFVVYFFRDPIRAVPEKEGLVISPGDGRVISILQNQSLPDGLGTDIDESEDFTKISIFLSVFDVHVNRIPVSGKIMRTFYYEGKFLNAELDKASEENERSVALVQTPKKQLVAFSQIAGFVARRIITTLKEGDDVETGKRFGIIRFGSRCDVYLPKGVNPIICVGQRTVGGETILADLTSKQDSMTATNI